MTLVIEEGAQAPDFELEGELAVTAVVPPPKLAEAVALAHPPAALVRRGGCPSRRG